ncbi:MAG: type IV toxin-antitoxin system AbiEi family antitoxin domain-containing protein [Candidatus Heimdallarchaeaceae archaeon]
MKRKLKPLDVIRELKKKKIRIFTPLEFKRLFAVSDYATQWFIKTHTKKKLFVKIRNGLYMLADYPANHYLIANRLYEPSYISFDAALSFHGIIPETIYAVTSATTKTTREFEADNIRFVYHKLKKEAYTGYKAIKHSDNTILMAEPEKALADYLYFVALKKRGLHYERLDLKKIKKTNLLSYIKLFKRPEMVKLVEKIYVEFRKPKRIY